MHDALRGAGYKRKAHSRVPKPSRHSLPGRWYRSKMAADTLRGGSGDFCCCAPEYRTELHRGAIIRRPVYLRLVCHGFPKYLKAAIMWRLV